VFLVLSPLLHLDMQTALCLMNIPFALCLTEDEYRHAVHSLRLDESLLTVLAQLTADPTFLRWRPGTPVIRVDTNLDVPRAVYEHAVVCEYTHERLRQLAAASTRPRQPEHRSVSRAGRNPGADSRRGGM
jgi:hypothetical protein